MASPYARCTPAAPSTPSALTYTPTLQGAIIARHNVGVNAAYFDGHSKFSRITDLLSLKVETGTGYNLYTHFTKAIIQ